MSMQNRKQLIQQKAVFISCIVPVFNEETVVIAFFPALFQTLSKLTNRFEIIVVNDGSHDATLAKLLELSQTYPLKILSFSRNFGKEVALTAGLDHARGDV